MQEELKASFLFARLTDAQMDRVVMNAHRVKLSARESLFEQGDVANRFFLVIEGHIKLFRLAPSGDEKIIEVVAPGGTFAEALMFLDTPRYPVGADALTRAELISIDADDFSAMLCDSVETCFLLMGDMSQRLRALIREIDELTLHTASCRLANYIDKQLDPDSSHLKLNVTKVVLASRLSIKPETFSRIVKDMDKKGIISVDGPNVVVHDREGLKTIAGYLPNSEFPEPPTHKRC